MVLSRQISQQIPQQQRQQQRQSPRGRDDDRATPSPIKHHLKNYEHRLMKKMTDKIDALIQQTTVMGGGKEGGVVHKVEGAWSLAANKNPNYWTHPLCGKCKGRHGKTGENKCPSVT